MIDVFIASGAAHSAPSVQSADTTRPVGAEPAPVPQVPAAAPEFAKNANNKTPERRTQGRSTPEEKRPSEKPADRKRLAARKAPAPASRPDKSEPYQRPRPLLAFTREDYPDLKFTALTGYVIGGVSRQGRGLNWSGLFEEAVAQAIEAGHGASDLEEVGVRLREGRHSKKGFRWCERLNRSVQVSTSNYMFTRILRIADLLGVAVRVGVSWEDVAGAAHPGRSGLISAKPLRRPAPGPERASPRHPAEPDPSGARFPTVGSLVSYVYLDRPDNEKLSLLVGGTADPEAGEVSASSPLGIALLETPAGSVATIDAKGVNRRVKVIEVVLG
jgi:hypothetical protein